MCIINASNTRRIVCAVLHLLGNALHIMRDVYIASDFATHICLCTYLCGTMRLALKDCSKKFSSFFFFGKSLLSLYAGASEIGRAGHSTFGYFYVAASAFHGLV